MEEEYHLALRVKEKFPRNIRKRPIPRGVESLVQRWRGGTRTWNSESISISDRSVGYQRDPLTRLRGEVSNYWMRG